MIDEPQSGLKCPIPESGDTLTRVKSVVGVRVPKGPVGVKTG